MKEPIIVIGHKNPDTDSVCSAIAYANLKHLLNGENYSPKRAGHLNEETQYVLKAFNADTPEYIKDVRAQIRDVDISEIDGVDESISLKCAWNFMKEQNVSTLPVVKNKRLCGIITIGDIAKSLMDAYDNRILSEANVSYKNIADTLEGIVEVGDASGYFNSGKVIIATTTPGTMKKQVEPGDMVILGNRYEEQICAIEMNAACIVISEGAQTTVTIRKLAEEKGCTIIRTPYDTYTVARFINQSMPIGFIMRRDGLVTFHIDDRIDNIQDIMAKKRYRDFPVLDANDNYMGMISRRNLLGTNKKRIILVDHNEKNQAVGGVDQACILEIIDHHRLGTIETMSPVYFRNQPLGCTATIIYQMYREYNIQIGKDIAGLLCAAILSDTLIYRSPTCTETDVKAAKELADIAGINDEEFAANMFNAGSNLSQKNVKDIFYQDFKRFTVNDTTFGVGQINSMSEDELDDIKQRLVEYIKEIKNNSGMSMIFFMLTNIMAESSELLFSDESARKLIETAFNVKVTGDSAYLDGVVSRKKQLVPAIIESLQQ